MTARTSLREPSRIGNPRNEQFRGFDDLDRDVLFNFGERIIDWIEATTTEGKPSNHFGIREAEHDEEGIKSGKAALRSLLLLSHKFHSIGTLISLQSVTLWNYQLPSFLRYLMKHPESAAKIRSLTFVSTIEEEVLDSTMVVAHELKSVGHPRIITNQEVLMENEKITLPINILINEIIGMARSLIIEECTNLRDLTFNSQMGFPFCLEKSPRFIFSQRLTSIKMDDFGLAETELTGRQALAVLIFLPSLQSASLILKFNYEDAKVVNTHLPSLIKSNKAVSKVKNLSLKIHQELPKKKSQSFNFDSTLITFTTIFKYLENASLSFIQDPRTRDLSYLEAKTFERPTVDVLQGLSHNFSTLKSLSFQGQIMDKADAKQLAQNQKFYYSLLGMSNLVHLRVDIHALFLMMDCLRTIVDSLELLPQIKSLELANNYIQLSNLNTGRSGEQQLSMTIRAGVYSKKLKLIRIPKDPTPLFGGRITLDSAQNAEFQSFRKELLLVANFAGIKVEFV